jgi:ATP-dependent Clp protease ATP-binding subunit ClpC
MMKRAENSNIQEQWEEDAKNNRIEVTDNVADVVSMMTGFS